MSRNESKRQKRLAKQKSKRKQKHQEISRERNLGLAERLARFESAPVLDCLVNANFETEGIANLFLGRKAASGEMVLATFLVDLYCMGVKDCFARIATPAEYRDVVERYQELGVRSLDPPSARKLVEDALEFAKSVGLSSHEDFRKVRPILNGIDPAGARETFPMGKDGKPYFVAGPGQSPEECRRILAQLATHCEEGEYHYMFPAGGPGELLPGLRILSGDEEFADDDWEEYDEDDEYEDDDDD